MAKQIMKQGQDVEQQTYDLKQCAQALGIGVTTLHKAIREGRIRPIKIGRRTLIAKSEVERFLSAT